MLAAPNKTRIRMQAPEYTNTLGCGFLLNMSSPSSPYRVPHDVLNLIFEFQPANSHKRLTDSEKNGKTNMAPIQ
jgi:hypothetical protein